MFSQLSLKQLALLSLSTLAAVEAAPGPRCTGRGTVAQIASTLNNPSGTSFCSSYLDISTSTSTYTRTRAVNTVTFVATTSSTRTITNTVIGSPDVTASPVPNPTTTHTEFADDPTSTVYTCSTEVAETERLKKRTFTTSSYTPAQITKGCKCLHITTPTVTSTTVTKTTVTVSRTSTAKSTTYTRTTVFHTTTPTTIATTTVTTPVTQESCPPAPTPDTSCDNEGLAWGHLHDGNRAAGNDFSDNTWSSYDLAYIKTGDTDASGTTETIGFEGLGSNDFTPYGTADPLTSDSAAINHQGFLYAAKDGDYTFTLSRVDDLVLVWVGEHAYATWTRDNANLDATWYQDAGASQGDNGTPLVFTFSDVAAGDYIPLRVVWVNASGDWGFKLVVTDPDDVEILSGTPTDQAVTKVCGLTTYPEFPAFPTQPTIPSFVARP